MRRAVLFALAGLVATLAPAADDALAADHLEVRWVRNSIEYSLLTQQIYRNATTAVTGKKRRGDWAVVLDVDETVLDNSIYQLERGTYAEGFDWPSWNAWTERRAAVLIPGAAAFIQAVRDAGGRVAFVTNRHEVTRQATIDNLRSEGVWQDGDVICLKTDDKEYSKRVRRTQLREGQGPCSWPGEPVAIHGYFGDTYHDLPEPGEEEGAWADNLGVRYFVLPNPMYGSWEREVTRFEPPTGDTD